MSFFENCRDVNDKLLIYFSIYTFSSKQQQQQQQQRQRQRQQQQQQHSWSPDYNKLHFYRQPN